MHRGISELQKSGILNMSVLCVLHTDKTQLDLVFDSTCAGLKPFHIMIIALLFKRVLGDNLQWLLAGFHFEGFHAMF